MGASEMTMRIAKNGVTASDGRLTAALAEALDRRELGIQVAVYSGPDLVAEGWAGDLDLDGVPVGPTTVFPVFSVTKAITAAALHIQAERGLIAYNAPVAAFWPEFAVNGKGAVTVEQILTHQSGVPQMPINVTPELTCDWQWMVEQLAQLPTLFEPGSRNAYQALSFGWLVGELVRRTDPECREFGTFVRDEITRPLGIENEVWIGIPRSELSRCATLVSDLPAERSATETALSLAAKPPSLDADAAIYNRDDMRMACLPGGGAIASARGVARFFAMLANGGELDGVRLLSRDRLRHCATPRDRWDAPDEVLYGGNRVMPMGKGGFWLDGTVFGGGPAVLCHAGLGGSAGFADMESRLAVAMCHNRLFPPQAVTSPAHPFYSFARAVRQIIRAYV